MITLFERRQWATLTGSSGTQSCYWSAEYESRRDPNNGLNIQYRFHVRAWIYSSYYWLNRFGIRVYLNSDTYKPNESGTSDKTTFIIKMDEQQSSYERGWDKDYTTPWYTIENMLSGEISIYFSIVDLSTRGIQGVVEDSSPKQYMPVPPAMSEVTLTNNDMTFDYINDRMKTTSIGFTFQKYDANFTDIIKIYYGDNKYDINSIFYNDVVTEISTSVYISENQYIPGITRLIYRTENIKINHDDDGYYYDAKLNYSTYDHYGTASQVLIGEKEFPIKIYFDGILPKFNSSTGINFVSSTYSLAEENVISGYSDITCSYDFEIAADTDFPNSIKVKLIGGDSSNLTLTQLTTEDGFTKYRLTGYYEDTSKGDYTLYIEDERGLALQYNNIKEVKNYFSPSYTNMTKRNSATGGDVSIEFDCKYWDYNFINDDISSKNEIYVYYKSEQEFGDNNWHQIPSSALEIKDTNIIHCKYITSASYPYNQFFNIQLKIIDKMTSELNENDPRVLTPVIQILKGAPVFYWTDKDFYVGATGTDAKIYLNGEEFHGGGGSSLESAPVGSILGFGGSTAPQDWLICDGSAISRTQYSELFEIIGTTYGAGDGSTTFNLPDLKGRVIVGAGEGTDSQETPETKVFTLGEKAGEYEHKLIANEMPSHTHIEKVTGNDWNQNYYVTNSGSTSGVRRNNQTSWGSGTPVRTESTGGNQPHNNIQPYGVANYIIKYTNSHSIIPSSAQVLNNESHSTTDTYSCEYINQNGGSVTPSDLLNYIYPIGSIYMSVNNVSPQVFLGGTWEVWGAGKVPVSVDTNDTSFNTVEKTGGSKNYQKHNHRGRYRGGSLGTYYFVRRINSADGYDGEDQVTYDAGSGTGDNLQPYITCYMWKRTA